MVTSCIVKSVKSRRDKEREKNVTVVAVQIGAMPSDDAMGGLWSWADAKWIMGRCANASIRGIALVPEAGAQEVKIAEGAFDATCKKIAIKCGDDKITFDIEFEKEVDQNDQLLSMLVGAEPVEIESNYVQQEAFDGQSE